VLTALALAGWGVRAAGTPRNDVARNSSVPLAQAPNQAGGQNTDANNGQNTAEGQNPDANTGQAPAEGNQQPAVGVKTTSLTVQSLKAMGQVVTDSEGFTLYRFDKDKKDSKTSACVDKCAKVWPPAIIDNGQQPELKGVDPKQVSTIQRQDGGTQLAIGGWPVYRYIGDLKALSWKGQGVGNTWFVVNPDGTKNLTCLPKVPPKAVEPPADNPGGGNGGGTSGGGDYNSGGGGGGY
jgi:predicted lipoprotein with Yx(FWY)xxD motif